VPRIINILWHKKIFKQFSSQQNCKEFYKNPITLCCSCTALRKYAKCCQIYIKLRPSIKDACRLSDVHSRWVH